MADDVFIPDPNATHESHSFMVDSASAGLSSAQQMVYVDPGYIGPVGTWETNRDGQRVRFAATITEWDVDTRYSR